MIELKPGIGDPRTMSFGQERLWILDRLEPGNPAYNVAAYHRLYGPVDPGALQRSLSRVARRHSGMRTSFSAGHDGRPHQEIAADVPAMIRTIDLSPLSDADRANEMMRLGVELADEPFDLSAVPLFRTSLLHLADDDHLLLFAMHHIISDAWSMEIVFRDWAREYEAILSGRVFDEVGPTAIEYIDFATWQRQRLQAGEFGHELEYWRKQLADVKPLQLPLDHVRPPRQTFSGDTVERTLSPVLRGDLLALAHNERATLYMVLLSVFQLLLANHSGQRDIVVGSPIAGRLMPETEELVGFFLNTLVIRTDVGRATTFLDLLTDVRQTVLQALDHQELPFERLVSDLELQRDVSRPALVQVLFTLLSSQPAFVTDKVSSTDFRMPIRYTKYDLTLMIIEGDQGLSVYFNFNPDLFQRSAIARMADQYEQLLQSVAGTPDALIATLGTDADAPKGLAVVDGDEDPDRPASAGSGCDPALDHEPISPRTETERKLAAIWAEVLGTDDFGVTDNFFELGGDSLLALQIVAWADASQLLPSVSDLFEFQTIETLGAALDRRRTS